MCDCALPIGGVAVIDVGVVAADLASASPEKSVSINVIAK